MKNELMSQICKEFNITEASAAGSLCNAIYSTTGKMALASLWDHSEGENFVSVQHFKKRAAQILDAYLDIYSEGKLYFPADRSGVVEDIYETYRRNGFFYHSPHRLYPATPSVGGTKYCSLFRGIQPNRKWCMSGLGFYEIKQDANSKIPPVEEMFNLQQEPLFDYLQELLVGNNWSKIEWPEDAEFLRLKPPFSRGYWQNQPDKTENISMARYGAPYKLYFFYRWKNGHFEQKPISEWRLDDFRTIEGASSGGYRRIASGLLVAYQQLPPITAIITDSNVEIKIGYRLPPEEEDFFKLYSWPKCYDITAKRPQVFQRDMNKMVYPVFKQHMESIGYHFMEE